MFGVYLPTFWNLGFVAFGFIHGCQNVALLKMGGGGVFTFFALNKFANGLCWCKALVENEAGNL